MSDDRAPRAVHTLVITVDPPGGNPDPPEPAGSTYAVECPGVTDDSGCRTYWECIECNAAYARDDEAISEALEADGEAHGIEHRQVGDVGWATPSDDCWAQRRRRAARGCRGSVRPGEAGPRTRPIRRHHQRRRPADVRVRGRAVTDPVLANHAGDAPVSELLNPAKRTPGARDAFDDSMRGASVIFDQCGPGRRSWSASSGHVTGAGSRQSPTSRPGIPSQAAERADVAPQQAPRSAAT